MGILLGLTTALSWGVADFLVRGVTRVIGAFRTLLYMQIAGLILVTLYLAATAGFARASGAPPLAWVLAVIAGLLNIFSSLLLYRAFQTGALVLVAPITASYGALTVVLSLLSGEVLSPARVWGIGAAMLGLVLTSLELDQPIQRGSGRLPPGVIWALGAAACYGVLFWLLGFGVTPYLGGILPVWMIRVVTLAVLLVVTLVMRDKPRLPERRVWPVLIFCGLIDTVAYAASTMGMQTEQVSIVTVLSSLYGTVTVLLAFLFLRERLRRTQIVGVLLIFAGIVLVSL